MSRKVGKSYLHLRLVDSFILTKTSFIHGGAIVYQTEIFRKQMIKVQKYKTNCVKILKVSFYWHFILKILYFIPPLTCVKSTQEIDHKIFLFITDIKRMEQQ